jgi:hypothetical protein
MQIYQNIVSKNEIATLLEYHYLVDARTDARPDVVSKHPRWGIDQWPEHIIKNVLDQVLDYDYIVEETIFNQSRIAFRLHVDSADGNLNTLGDVILIPLYTQGPSSTVFFENFWLGPSTKFSRHPIPLFEYNLPDTQGNWHYVKDLRELLKQIDQAPDSITWTTVNDKLRETVTSLILARSGRAISQVDDRTYDYSNIVNYDATLEFSTELHQKYLQHIPIENLHGLTFADAIQWIPGDAIKFNRTRLHSAGYGHKEKIGLTIFTKRC